MVPFFPSPPRQMVRFGASCDSPPLKRRRKIFDVGRLLPDKNSPSRLMSTRFRRYAASTGLAFRKKRISRSCRRETGKGTSRSITTFFRAAGNCFSSDVAPWKAGLQSSTVLDSAQSLRLRAFALARRPAVKGGQGDSIPLPTINNTPPAVPERGSARRRCS